MDLPGIFAKGGPLMYLIFGCSVLSLGAFVERLHFLKKINFKAQAFMERFKDLVNSGHLQEASILCQKEKSPIVSIVSAGLDRGHKGKDSVREGMQATLNQVLVSMEKNISIIATISHVTPLMGLLGTVIGMIKAFLVIQSKGGVVNPSDLAGGISEALITTAFGLCVAIPSYIGYSYLNSLLNNRLNTIDKITRETLEILDDKEREKDTL